MREPHRGWAESPGAQFWVVTGVALVLRLLHIVAMSDPARNPAFLAPVMDAGVHDRWAEGLVAGTWPPAEPFFRAPLYPYFLGLLYGVFGSSHHLAVQVVHGVVSAIGPGLAALAARRLWDARAGWAAGLLLAGSWSSIWFSGELLAVTLVVSLDLLGLWLLLGRLDRRRLVGSGFVFGLAAITRPTVLAVLPAVLWYVGRAGPAAGVRRAASWLWLAVGLVAAIAPVSVRNLVRGGEPVVIAASGGVNFYIGNNPWANGRVAFLPGAPLDWQGELGDVVALARRESGEPLGALGADRWFWRQGLGWWRDDPRAALVLTARKIGLLAAAQERSNNRNLPFWCARSPVLRWPVWPGWALLLGLAVVGLARRDLPPDRRRLLVGLLVLSALALLPFFVNARFRLPLLAWLAVPAGGGAVAVWETMRRRGTGLVPRAALVAAGAVVTVSVVPDAVAYRPDPANDFESWRSLGNSYLQIGDEKRAMAAWEEALAADARKPHEAYRWTLPQVYSPLVQLHLQQHRPDAALAVQRRWAARLPDDVHGQLGLANMLLAADLPREALPALEKVLQDHPENLDARLGRAWTRRRLGDAAGALADFTAVVARKDNANAELGVGLALVDLGRWAEAEAHLTALQRRHPELWEADESLAAVYEATGRIAEARASWRRVLAARPGNARARENLARLGP